MNFKFAVTHDGSHQADEVFATALITMLYRDIIILRTRNVEVLNFHKKQKTSIVYDVGMELDHYFHNYDHHMPNSLTRPDNIPYSALGLLWLFLKDEIQSKLNISELSWQELDQGFIREIDANDNGCIPVGYTSAVSLIAQHNTVGDFYTALNFAENCLQTILDNKRAEDKIYEDAKSKIISIDNRILVIDHEHYHVVKRRQNLDLDFVIYREKPNTVNNYRVDTVNVPGEPFRPKINLSLDPVDGVNFVHKARFTAGADTIQPLLKLIELSILQNVK